MLFVMAALLAGVSSRSAAAQAEGDVVVFRRVVATPSPVPTPVPVPTPTPAPNDPDPGEGWLYHGWSEISYTVEPSCSRFARVKSVWGCVRYSDTQDERVVDEVDCLATPETAGPKPSPERTAPNYDTCTYERVVHSWGDWSSTCSEHATRTRTDACLRSDQTWVPMSLCASSEPESVTETAAVIHGCTYVAGPPPGAPTCSTDVNREWIDTGTCTRSDGKIVEVQPHCPSRMLLPLCS